MRPRRKNPDRIHCGGVDWCRRSPEGRRSRAKRKKPRGESPGEAFVANRATALRERSAYKLSAAESFVNQHSGPQSRSKTFSLASARIVSTRCWDAAAPLFFRSSFKNSMGNFSRRGSLNSNFAIGREAAFRLRWIVDAFASATRTSCSLSWLAKRLSDSRPPGFHSRSVYLYYVFRQAADGKIRRGRAYASGSSVETCDSFRDFGGIGIGILFTKLSQA